MEPQVTLRGHGAAITSIAIAPHRGLVYSASLDATIHVWAIPNTQHTTYSPYESSTSRGPLIGHSDAVWDLSLLREGSMLVSCGADGMVKVWDVGTAANSPGNLRLSWGYTGTGTFESAASTSSAASEDVVGATVVEGIKTNLRMVAVAYCNAVIKLFDVENGKELGQLPSDSYGKLYFLLNNEHVLNSFDRWYTKHSSQRNGFAPHDGYACGRIRRQVHTTI